MTTKLEADIEELYRVFATYPLKPRIEGCPHCELQSSEASLHARDLRELTWADFGVFPFKAMTTFGDERDFKHFLPRILDLYVFDHVGSHYDVDTIFSKLEYANWQSWPQVEVLAIKQFVAQWRADLRAIAEQSSGEPWELEELESALSEFLSEGAA